MRDSLPDISLCILYTHFKRTAIIRSDIYTPSYRLGGGRMNDVGYGGGGGDGEGELRFQLNSETKFQEDLCYQEEALWNRIFPLNPF